MTCVFDVRWIGDHGIGRFAREVGARLPHTSLVTGGRPSSPIDPIRLSTLPFGSNEWLLSPGINGPLCNSVPYVMTVHDLNHIDRQDNSSAYKRLYYRTILKRLCGNATAVLTVSEFSRARIIDWFGVSESRVFNVMNGVSRAFQREGPVHQSAVPYFLCVSNRRGHKNENGVLEAFASTDPALNTRLVLTGEASPELREAATKLGVTERLSFAGRVSEHELAALYRGALALVFPSFYEGFGLPIVEAFACGTPVITSNVTAMPEIAGDAAMLVDPTKVSDIAHCMAALTNDSALREHFIARGYERSLLYSWDSVCDRIVKAVSATRRRDGRELSWRD